LSHIDREILVYGASGFTGQCCVTALEEAGLPYRVGGRSAAKLEAVAGPGCVGMRVADAANLGDAFADASCVIATVGPFARHGLPVLDAAIAAGAHYVDTTAEQPFMRSALTRHDAAVSAGITALPACGVEYAPMFLAAALLGDGPVDSYLWLDDFLPTRGSVRSMVAMAGVGPLRWPRAVQIEERRGYAVTIPGAEAVFLHPDCTTHLMLRAIEAFPIAAIWPIAKLLPPGRFADAIADRLTDPTPQQRAAATFTVVVTQGGEGIRIDGQDVYASTGRFAVQLARLLTEGRAHSAGILPVGAALDPRLALAALGLTARRISAAAAGAGG
jgi:hypothetical protein